MGRVSIKEPFEFFSTRIAPSLERRLRDHAKACGVKINDLCIRAFELYLSRPRKTKPAGRETIVRKKRTKGGR